MIYLVTVVIISMGLVFFMPWHGLTGAVLLGLDLVILDFFWQCLRWRQFTKAKRSGRNLRSSFGFLIRLANLVFWLKIGQAWLAPQYFMVCATIALTLPITNICGAYLLSRGVFIDGNF
jgi:hypothetical protein